MQFFGIDPDFALSKQLISRSLDVARPKRLYFVSSPIYDLMIKDEREQLKIAATGLKVRGRGNRRGGVNLTLVCLTSNFPGHD